MSLSFFVSRENLSGSLKRESADFVANGRSGKKRLVNGAIHVMFPLKNGILDCLPEREIIRWTYHPAHSANFREKVVLSPVTKKIELSASPVSAASAPSALKNDHAIKDIIMMNLDPDIYLDFENGAKSYFINSHGHDFEIGFGSVRFGSLSGMAAPGNGFEHKCVKFDNFALKPEADGWRVSWNKDGGRKTLFFNLRGEDGQIRIGSAFIMIAGNEASDAEGFDIKKHNDAWAISFTPENDMKVMLSTASGTVTGTIREGDFITDQKSDKNILSGEFTLDFDTEVKFYINNREAKKGENGEPYFIMGEGRLVLSRNGKTIGYVFHPNVDHIHKSFARRIDIDVKYPDNSFRTFGNLPVQQFALPTISDEAEND